MSPERIKQERKQRLRVLIINQYFPSDTAATAAIFSDVAKALSNSADTTVVCGRASYDPPQGTPWRPIQRDSQGEVEVIRIGSTAFDRRWMPGRWINYLSFVAMASVRGLTTQRPDVVVVGSDPPFGVWAALASARGRPVVYSVQDLHPEFALVSGMIRPGFIAAGWERAHNAALRRCAKVVCLGETMAEKLTEKGVRPEKIEVIPHGAWKPTGGPDPSLVAELRGPADFVVMHAGNLGGAGAWHTLARAAAHLQGTCEFVFVGDGSSRPVLEGTPVRLVPFQSTAELASVMAAGDLQVVTLRQGMEGLVVPSKLYTILAHGRPVLAVAAERSEVAQIVTRYRCGLVADPNDPADVAEKVQWARSNPNELAAMSERAREASRQFDRGVHLRRFVEVVERAAGEARSTPGPAAVT